MSTSSYHRWDCEVCGGRTTTCGFAEWNHQHSARHIAALALNHEPAHVIARLKKERAEWLQRRARYRPKIPKIG